MNEGIILIKRSAKQKLWMIKGLHPFFVSRKNLYLYDFAVIAIREMDGSLRKYCNNSDQVDIEIACQCVNHEYNMLVHDGFRGQAIPSERIDAIFIYFEKASMATIAFTTKEMFKDTGFFMNNSSSIESLREEAMAVAYMMDDTKGIYDLFKSISHIEGGSDLYE